MVEVTREDSVDGSLALLRLRPRRHSFTPQRLAKMLEVKVGTPLLRRVRTVVDAGAARLSSARCIIGASDSRACKNMP